MIREVCIDGLPVDIEDNSVDAYLLKSPIFRDISQIMSNRTTSYKIPMTARNAAIFKLYEQPDIIDDYARKWHQFEEWRDGFLFVKGICRILEASGGYYELAVSWGNAIRLLAAKDKKLRDMNLSDALAWNESTKFIAADSNAGAGFFKIDLGLGIDDISKSRPCVNIRKILDYIKKSEKIDFRYPERFDTLFKTTWIPLLDNKLSSAVWDMDYTTYTNVTASVSDFQGSKAEGKILWVYLYVEGGAKDIIEHVSLAGYGGSLSYVKNNQNPVYIRSKNPFFIKVDTTNPKAINWKIRFEVDTDYQDFPLMKDGDTYQAYCDINIVAKSNNKTSYPIFKLIDETNDSLKVDILKLPKGDMKLNVQVQKREATFGDPLPIIANLPDLKIIDFIKAIMNMFGLFTYYRQQTRENNIDIIEFISIDDMYNNIPNAYDWTDKVIDDNKRKITRVYGDYAQRNFMRYKENDELQESPDGYIDIEDLVLQDTKDLFTLPFAASMNNTDMQGNTYAKIALFDQDGKASTTTPRILVEKTFKDSNKEDYLSAYFPKSFMFGGDNGLIKKYYIQYQYILRKPLTMLTTVYLNSADISTLDERMPVYIDGVHYMPTNWDIFPIGNTDCLLLRMPPL